MPDPSQISRLNKLRITREYLAYQLQGTDTAIRELAAQEKQNRHRAEQARQDQGWKIQPKRGEAPPVLHRDGCATYKAKDGMLLDRAQARLAVPHETYIVMCEICTRRRTCRIGRAWHQGFSSRPRGSAPGAGVASTGDR